MANLAKWTLLGVSRSILAASSSNSGSKINNLRCSSISSCCCCCCGLRFCRLTSHWQTWRFSSTSTYHSTDLLTARGVAHLVIHGTSGSTSYETIPHVRLETSGGVLSTADMVMQRRDGPRRLRELDDDDDDD